MSNNDHLENCVNAKLSQQLDYIQLKLKNQYEISNLCYGMISCSWIVILVLAYLIYGIHKEYRAFHTQAIEYGWIEYFDAKNYPQIKLNKMKPIVSDSVKPITIHYSGEVLDNCYHDTWHKFHITVEPKWETPQE